MLKRLMQSELEERRDLILPYLLLAAEVGDLKELQLEPQGPLRWLQELQTLMAIFLNPRSSLRLRSH